MEELAALVGQTVSFTGRDRETGELVATTGTVDLLDDGTPYVFTRRSRTAAVKYEPRGNGSTRVLLVADDGTYLTEAEAKNADAEAKAMELMDRLLAGEDAKRGPQDN